MSVPAWFEQRKRRAKKAHKRKFRSTVIAQSAVNEFLHRDREDYNWIKREWVWNLRKYVYDRWNGFHTTPRTPQLAGFALGMDLNEFIFNFDCGVGKTKLLLDLVRYHRISSNALRWIVMVPNIINLQSWEDQIDEHAPDLTYEVLVGDRATRHSLVNSDVNLCLLNYPGLQTYMTERVHDKEGGWQEVNKRSAKNFATMFDGVLFDELHTVGNHKSLTYRLCTRLSNACEFKYGSTATLFGDDPTMLWPQFKLIDRGKTLGETLAIYRAAFFDEEPDLYRGVRFVFDQKKERKLGKFIRNLSLRYTAEECGDIPKVSRVRERLTWDEEQLAYYTRLRNDCRIAGVGKVRLNPNTFARMRQICSGWVGYTGEDDTKAKLTFKHNPKLERLLQIIEEMPLDTKIIVYFQYVFTGDLICQALEKEKVGVAKLYGTRKEAPMDYRRFLEEDPDEYKVLAAQYRRVAGGNPHKVASFIYNFESPPDPITREQCDKRVDRPGQPRKVFNYDCIMPHSFEEQMLDDLEAGRNFSKRVQEGRASA